MTDLSDRLDRLARQAAAGLELLPLELALRARRRRRTRLRFGVLVVAALVTGGSLYGVLAPSHHRRAIVNVGGPPTTAPTTTHLAPLPDTSLTPPGWSPVALGPVQISVPSSWAIEDREQVCGGGLTGMVFIDRQPSLTNINDPQCVLTTNVVTMLHASGGAVPHARAGRLNSIPVVSGWSAAEMPGTRGKSLASKKEIVRALGYDITATGPLADKVLHTLTHSPLSVVLNSEVMGTPADWQSIFFGGLRFSVPSRWQVSRDTSWDGCPYNLAAKTLRLSTAQTQFTVSCPPPDSTAGYDAGVPAMVVGSGPLVGAHPAGLIDVRPVYPGGRCMPWKGLQICIDPYPDKVSGGYAPGHGLSVLTMQLSVPGQPNLDQIEIGLSGDGTTALKIFDSLRPASSSTLTGTLRGVLEYLPVACCNRTPHVVPGTIFISAPNLKTVTVPATAGIPGGFSVSLPVGSYTVKGTSPEYYNGFDSTCDGGTVQVTAGQTTSVTLVCPTI